MTDPAENIPTGKHSWPIWMYIFCCITLVLSVAALVVSLTRNDAPINEPTAALPFRSLDEISVYLENVQNDITTIESIDNIIQAVKIDNGHQKTVGIVCGLVANDFTSVDRCLSLITKMSTDVNYVIYPLSNPSGYDYALTNDMSWTRNRRDVSSGCEGVRVDRNFDFEFRLLECSTDLYGGPAAESETEVIALVQHISAIAHEAVVVVGTNNARPTMTLPYYRNTNKYRRMEHRLRKSWDTKGNVVRPNAADQFGKLSEWAQEQSTITFSVEIDSDSVETIVDFVNSISKIIRNQEEISWSSIDTYVWEEDENYQFNKVSTIYNTASITHQLHMTSQQWLNDTLTDHPIWRHKIDIIIPTNVVDPTAMFLHVTSGTNDIEWDYDIDTIRTVNFAESSGIVSAVLHQVPNQPIVFNPIDGVPGQDLIYANGRTEDGIIARCWRMFIDNYNDGLIDHGVLVQNAMAKSAVRGLDTITEFVYNKTGNYPLRAGVTGASKRGWTTWLTAAVDYERVTFMAPVFFDELNMVENIHQHYRSLGGYTYAFFDYYYAGITEYLDSDAVQESLKVLDVLTFKDRYGKFQTNYMINAGNDEFFLLGNPKYFFHHLSPKTLLRVLPNQGHGGIGGGVDAGEGELDGLWTSIEAIFTASLWNPELIPVISTIHTDTSEYTTITCQSSKQANFVRAWSTDSFPGSRDFRLRILKSDNTTQVCSAMELLQAVQAGLEFSPNPNDYTAEILNENSPATSAVYTLDAKLTPNNVRDRRNTEEIWRGGFIEYEFDLNGKLFKATSIPAIVPYDRWAVEDCTTPEECRGCLV